MLNPTAHHVLVKQCPIKRKFGSIIVQHEDEKLAQNAQQIGKIVAIGPNSWEAFGPDWKGRPWAKVGDLVYFPRFCGGKVEDPFTGEEFILMSDEDVKVICTDGPNPKVELPEFEFILTEDNMSEAQAKEVKEKLKQQERQTYGY